MRAKVKIGPVEFESNIKKIVIDLIGIGDDVSEPVTIYFENGVSINTETKSPFYVELEKIMNKSRAKTKEEMRAQFLSHVRGIALEWSQYNTDTELERCNGVAFSILSLLDGSSVGFPATNISLSTHPDDKEFYIKNGENWVEDGMVINDDVMLHEMYYE